jgi:formylglycine-generating enzyme required for sulfatase activity
MKQYLIALIDFGLCLAGFVFFVPRAKPFTNTLGMKFVPVPGTDVLFSIWETRAKDYAAYATANSRATYYLNQLGDQNPLLTTDKNLPIVWASWVDAHGFCEWLTAKERKEGKIGPGQEYRLPTDVEWSLAVGMDHECGLRHWLTECEAADVYPWGGTWPPPMPARENYAGEEAKLEWKIDGYNDGYPEAAPVGSFAPNQFGLYEMGGNVQEWCDDELRTVSAGLWGAVIRGESWRECGKDNLLSECRRNDNPAYRKSATGFRCVLGRSTSSSPSEG